MSTITSTSLPQSSSGVSENSNASVVPGTSPSGVNGPFVTATDNPFLTAMRHGANADIEHDGAGPALGGGIQSSSHSIDGSIPGDMSQSTLGPYLKTSIGAVNNMLAGNVGAYLPSSASTPTSAPLPVSAPAPAPAGTDATTDSSATGASTQTVPWYHTALVGPDPVNVSDEMSEEFAARNEELNFMKDDLAERIPRYRDESTSYMKQFIKLKFGIDIDPDKVYLNEYESIDKNVPSRAGDAYPPTKQEVGVGRLVSSTPLSKIPYSNLYSLISADTKRFHISTRNDRNQSAADEQDVIDPHAFYHSLKDLDFKTYYSMKIDLFYKNNRDDMRDIAQTEANLGIDKQFAAGQLDVDSYNLAKRAFDPNSNDPDPPKVYPFEVSGYQSNDGLVIVGKDRTLAYFRGDRTPITVLADPNGIAKKFGYGYDFPTDKGKLNRFTYKHFSVNDASGQSDGFGVQKALGSGEPGAWGAFKHSFVNWWNDPFSADKEMHKDPFGGLLDINQRHDKEDADFDITSNADVNKKKLNRGMDYVPLPFVPSAVKMGTAKTQAEQGDAAGSMFFDIALAGISITHPRVSDGIGLGTPYAPLLVDSKGLHDLKHASRRQLDRSKAADPHDPDDPNNTNNLQERWSMYPINNFSKSYETPDILDDDPIAPPTGANPNPAPQENMGTPPTTST